MLGQGGHRGEKQSAQVTALLHLFALLWQISVDGAHVPRNGMNALEGDVADLALSPRVDSDLDVMV